jgi:signal transduction histidine kinase
VARIGWPGPYLISVRRPNQGQKRLALSISASLLAICLCAVPFRTVQLGRVDAFIPVVDSIISLNDVLTAALLYVHYAVTRKRSLLVLANGFLLVALLVVPHQLTFPGAYSPSGLLGATLQTTAWLSLFRNVFFVVAVIAYSALNRGAEEQSEQHGHAGHRIAASVAAIVALAVSLTLLATLGAGHLPPLMADLRQGNAWYHSVVRPLRIALALAALYVFRRRPESIIELWLQVGLWGWFLFDLLSSVAPAVRYSLVFYVGFGAAALSSSFMLAALLAEVTMLHSRLILAVAAREQERTGRNVAVDVVVATIAHELRQPLTAIVVNGSAGERMAVETDETREIFRDIRAEATRASELLNSIRAAFTGAPQHRTVIDANEIVRHAVGMLRMELDAQQVRVAFDLSLNLPTIQGNPGQITQVIFNGLTNAIDSVGAVTAGPRLISVSTARANHHGVAIEIVDSGSGLDPEIQSRLFEPFATTKARGMGLGLSICQSIVEAHSGTLSLTSRPGRGAAFRVELPSVSERSPESVPVESVGQSSAVTSGTAEPRLP